MKFGALVGIGNTTWDDVLSFVQHLDATGWYAAWVPDHLISSQGGTLYEGWTMLAALAARTENIRLGTLVTANTFRLPAIVAKMAVNVDHISGGRLTLGMGTGWQQEEHDAYGIPFYSHGQRLRRLDEACEVIVHLFQNERTDFQGRYYQLVDAPLSPKPIQKPYPPILIGGGGDGTLRLAAKWANIWNWWGGPEATRERIAVLEQRCQEVGRNAADIEKTANAPLVLSEDRSEIQQASAAFGQGAGRWVHYRNLEADEARENMLIGSVAEVREQVQRYADVGVTQLMIPLAPSTSRDTLDRFMTDVAAKVG